MLPWLNRITEADVRTAGVFSDVAFDGTMRDGRESGLVVSALKSALAEQVCMLCSGQDSLV